MQLADLLEIQPGVTAVIGGGGKTSLLWNLGNELAGKQHTVLLCTTTKILPFPEIPCARTARELEYLRNTCRFFCAGQEIPETGKLTTPPIPMVQLASWFDYVLVEKTLGKFGPKVEVFNDLPVRLQHLVGCGY